MKKSRYYPFERNKYFYGKLLTVNDFESEQKYFNDKRRMLNRLLHGSGVMTGLEVVAVDKTTISVSMGAALDSLGREIIVPVPVTQRLALIPGFTSNGFSKNVYLCLGYEEKGNQPVNAAPSSSVRSDGITEYNRTQEGYKLYIREDAPDPTSLPFANLTDKTVMLYKEDDVRVLMTAPRYVNPGQLFELKLRFEKTLLTGKIDFKCELETERVTVIDSATLSFEELLEEQQTEHEVKVLLRADSTVGVKGKIGIKLDTVVFKLGDKRVDELSDEQVELEIMTGSVQDRLMKDFLKQPLEDALESSSDPCVYLAKIAVQQTGPSYMIDHVQRVPFNEYVYNSGVMQRLNRAEAEREDGPAPSLVTRTNVRTVASSQTPEFNVTYDKANSELSFDLAIPAGAQGSTDIRTGVVDIPISPFMKMSVSPFAKATKSFFSGEISHGLGEGNVLIVTSLEENTSDTFSDLLSSGERVYFGSSDVFKGSEFEPDLSDAAIGTLAYPQKGTFRIGVKVQQGAEASNVRVRWWAYKEQAAGSGSLNALDAALSGMREAASAGSGSEEA